MLGFISKRSKEWNHLLKTFHMGRDRYKRMETLGTSDDYEIVECFDQNLNRPVARKVLQHSDARSPEQLQLIINEARLISYLDHPGIVPVYDASAESSHTFQYTTKVLEGEGLNQLLEKQRQEKTWMPLSKALHIFTKLCETMAYVHDRGILHLDIKPEKVILGKYGEVFLVDWSTARLYDRSRYLSYLASLQQVSQGNDLQDLLTHNVGSIPYMPIEQITQNRASLKPSADIFSAGVLLYFMLTGEFPYSSQHANLQSYAIELQQGKSIPLQHRRGDISPRLSDICMGMLAINAQHRYSHFHEILRELQELTDVGAISLPQSFAPGDVIFTEGEPGYDALHILEGLVEVTTTVDGQTRVLSRCGSGDIIGDLAVLSGSTRSATVTAKEPTIVRILTKMMIEEELDKLNPWIGRMVRNLSHEFIETHPLKYQSDNNHNNQPIQKKLSPKE